VTLKGPDAATRSKVVKRARLDPVWFVEHILGDKPGEDSKKVLEAVRDNTEVSWRSCHSASKSWTAARVALWFLISHYKSRVITTAPTDRQVRGILWSEIRQAHANAVYPLGGRMRTQELEMDEEDMWSRGRRRGVWHHAGDPRGHRRGARK